MTTTQTDEATVTMRLWRAAAMKMVAGGFIVLACYGTLFVSGRNPSITQFLPMALLVGMVTLGIGLHSVLWAGPRSTSRVPPSLRSLVSALLTFGAIAALGMLIGLAAGIARGFGGHP